MGTQEPAEAIQSFGTFRWAFRLGYFWRRGAVAGGLDAVVGTGRSPGIRWQIMPGRHGLVLLCMPHRVGLTEEERQRDVDPSAVFGFSLDRWRSEIGDVPPRQPCRSSYPPSEQNCQNAADLRRPPDLSVRAAMSGQHDR